MRETEGLQKEYGKVAILMGGWSSEREVSLMSGKECLAALREAGIDAHEVDATRDVIALLKNQAFDRVFNVLHGKGGEDGELQGALQLSQIPFTGSGVLASALAHDKLRCKLLCKMQGIPTPEWQVVTSFSECRQAMESLGLPLVIKPTLEGSSIGVSIVKREENLQPAWEEAAKYGVVIAEKFINGMEVTASVLGDRVLPLINMSTDREFYDYHAKYFANDTRYECPAHLPEDVTSHIGELAMLAFQAIGCSGWGRIDFMLDTDLNPYFIEANTIPGMTSHSLVPMAARAVGIEFKDLCVQILNTSFGERK